MNIIGLYNHPELLKAGLLSSHPHITDKGPILIDNTHNEFESFGQAIRFALYRFTDDQVLVLAHQDALFYDPETFNKIPEWIRSIARNDDYLAGAVGQRSKKSEKEGCGVNPIISGGKQISNIPISEPETVQIIDECVMITNRQTIERFNLFTDNRFDWHLYAADASLTLAEQGYAVYVLPLKINHLSAGHVDLNYLNKAKLLLKKYGLKNVVTTNGLINHRILALRRFKRRARQLSNPLKQMIKFRCQSHDSNRNMPPATKEQS
ncbi:MAG: hypothetical protein U5R06_18940 [candidate division KSB1 bacterium]|nr:hypothetical protein [candidate division KSB1 bacterium]